MSGIFKFNNDKNSPKPSLSSPASLTTPTRPSRLGLFIGAHDSTSMMETSFSGANNVQPPKPSFSSNCPSSPAQGRSLREFEEQMAALRKENFNLKLRIYFLEEKPTTPMHHALANSSSCPNIDSIESISKQNIDLKVENESLRKELQEKQELLCQASKAMELMENQHKKESIEAQMIIDDLNHKIEAMTHEIKTFEKAFIESSKNHDTGFSDFLGAIDSKDIEAQRKIAEFELIMRSFSDQNEQLCQKIEKMELERAEITRKLNLMNYENAELKEKLDETVRMSDKDEIKKLQDECYETKRRLADAMAELEDIEKKFQEKSEAHEKSLEVIQKACEHIEDLELHVEQLKSSQPNSLSSTESAKNDDNFSHANGLIVKLRQQVEQITIEKNDEINRLKEELEKKSRMSFSPLSNSSTLNGSNTQSILQSINFPTNELSFNEVIEKNKSAQKRIHILKQKLGSNDTKNKIENELLQLQLKEAQNDLHESESALRQSVNFCGVLLVRLEELVKFLNSLIHKRDIGGILGYELKKAINRAVDRSFELSRSINFTQSNSMNISEMSMIDLVDSLASSTIANSMIDSLNSDNFQLKTENDSNKMKTSQASGKGHKSLRNTKKSLASMLLKQQSESEEWSEPDRDISKERIGLSTADESMTLKPHRTSTSDEEDNENDVGSEHKLVRKSDWKLIHEKIKSLENLLQEKNDKILEVSGMLLDAENDAKDKIIQIKKKLDEAEKDIQHYKTLYQQVTGDKCELTKSLQEKEATIEYMKSEKDKINVELKVLSSKYESQVDINHDLKNKFQDEEEKLHKLQLEYEAKCKTYDQLVTASEKREQAFKDEIQQNWIRKTVYTQLLHELEKKQERLKDYQQKFSAMEEEMKMMQNQVVESEDRLEKISRNLDTATLQLSTAAVERSKFINEKRSLEAKIKKINEDYQKLNIEKQEGNLKIADLEVFNAKLQNKLLIGGNEKIVIGTHLSDASGYASEDANALRSASFSSNDEKEFLSLDAYNNCMSCKKLANEMNEIRKNLNQSKKSLELAYSKLRNQNLRKAQIEMDIKQQIVKTQNVLQTVRTNMEIELTRGVPTGLKKES